MSAASIAAEVVGVGGQSVSAQTIRCTLHQIGLHDCRPRKKPLLKIMHKRNLFGSDGVKRVCQVRSTKTSVS